MRRGRFRRRPTAGPTLGPDSQGEPWPLPEGDYVVHYLLADEYESAGTGRVQGPRRQVSLFDRGDAGPKPCWGNSSAPVVASIFAGVKRPVR